MYSNSQWPGHSQPEVADMLQELVESVPQIPVGKIVKGVKSLISRPMIEDQDECVEVMPTKQLASEI